jgi:predicted component of type VI protein secretion system
MPDDEITNNKTDGQKDTKSGDSNRVNTTKITEKTLPEGLQDDSVRTLTFYLPSHGKPVVIADEEHITIGRKDLQRDLTPTLDLNNYNGARLGVSRLHAEVHWVDGHYQIKDCGSSNGTWLNSKNLPAHKLYPLTTGDELRFGHFVTFIHIHLPSDDAQPSDDTKASDDATITKEGADSEVGHTLMLDTTSDPLAMDASVRVAESQATNTYNIIAQGGDLLVAGNLPFAKFAHVQQFLVTLQALHDVMREAQGQQSESLAIASLQPQAETQSLQVGIVGAGDVLDFIAQKMPAWLAEKDAPKSDEAKSDSQAIIRHQIREQLDLKHPEAVDLADYMLQELVFRFLQEERANFIKRLAILLDRLLANPLRLAP